MNDVELKEAAEKLYDEILAAVKARTDGARVNLGTELTGAELLVFNVGVEASVGFTFEALKQRGLLDPAATIAILVERGWLTA